MRPIYETQSDLNKEQVFAKEMSEKWGYEFKKLSRVYIVDWMVMRNDELRCFAELKCRNNRKDKYPTLMLSLHKWMRGKELAKETNTSFRLIIKWEDGIFQHEAGTWPVTYGYGGRKDRADNQDMEAMVFIPTMAFKEIK